MNARTRSLALICLLLAAGNCLAAPPQAEARADDRPGSEAAAPRALPAIIADLAAAEFATRDAASRELAAREDLTLPQLETALAAASLAPEQRARLSTAARDRFARTPRAAMGVQFSNQLLNARTGEAMIVGAIFENFPSKKVLKVNDEILAIDGVSMRGKSSQAGLGLDCVRPYIISHDPGDLAKMTVRRDGQNVELEVPLGSFGSLPIQQGGFRDELAMQDLHAAWRLRVSGREGAGERPALAGPVLPARDGHEALKIEMDSRARAESGEWGGVLAGGCTREVDFASIPGEGVSPESRIDMEIENLAASLKARKLDLENVNASLKILQLSIADANRSPQERAAVSSRLQELSRQRDALSAQISDLVSRITTARLRQRNGPQIFRP